MKKLLLDFSAGYESDSKDIVVLWDRYVGGPDSYSLPQILRDSPEVWLDQYADWLAQISLGDFNDAGMASKLDDDRDLSYWWMTLPTEFTFYDDNISYRMLRLWVFAQIADQLDAQTIELVEAPPEILAIIEEWAAKTGRVLRITGSFAPETTPRSSLWDGFRFIISQYRDYRWRNGLSRPTAATGEGGLTVVDYFANFTVGASTATAYVSGYWGDLVKLLDNVPDGTRWIHNHYPSSAAPTAVAAHQKIKSLNMESPLSRHELLQDWTSLGVSMRAIVSLIRLSRRGRTLKRDTEWGHFPSGMNMWPLISCSWERWFEGVPAAQNILWPLLFGRALRTNSHRDACIYLMENQGWELALLAAWRRSDVGPAIGVVHSVPRIWDLRFLIRRLADDPAARLPQPDIVVANSSEAFRTLALNGYTDDVLRMGEAVRFSKSADSLGPVRETDVSTDVHRVLILGEYDAHMTARLVNLMNAILVQEGSRISVTYRPHPASRSSVDDLDPRIVVRSDEPLSGALARHQSVICSNVSSASIQAALSGIAPIVLLDGRVLDGVPLPEGCFHSACTFADVLLLLSKDTRSRKVPSMESSFFFGPGLPIWTKLLEPYAKTKSSLFH